jgi:hypothetical protein
MTGMPIEGFGDAIWDDGEWVSWDYINGQLYDQALEEEYPEASLEVIHIFEDLVRSAKEYHRLTGRYLQIWGELGELFAEIKYDIKRHAPGTMGSDGRMGNDFVEIKTISPEKGNETVLIKRAGNFNKILLVRITKDFRFESKLSTRKTLSKGKGKHAKLRWDTTAE